MAIRPEDHALQALVLRDVVNQVADGNRAIKGVMLESHLFEGDPETRPRAGPALWRLHHRRLAWARTSTADSLRAAAALLRRIPGAEAARVGRVAQAASAASMSLARLAGYRSGRSAFLGSDHPGPTRNLVKFHLIALVPSRPGASAHSRIGKAGGPEHH
jgi:hypothetical protein